MGNDDLIIYDPLGELMEVVEEINKSEEDQNV